MPRLRLAPLLALVLAGCTPPSGDGPGAGPSSGGSGTTSCKLAGVWTGSFTVTEVIVGSGPGAVRQQVNLEIPGECRLTITPAGAVTIEMGGMSRTHSRRGETFHNVIGDYTMVQTVMEYTVTADQIRDVSVDLENRSEFDMSMSRHAVTAILKDHQSNMLTETTYTLSGNQLRVRSTKQQHAETVVTVGTFTRVRN
jgi:hypothetical protein